MNTSLIVALTIGLLAVTEVANSAPVASWTPPPKKFTSDEWAAKTPTWAKTGSERGNTVVWFYKEMSQEEALPVLLRTLDYGETWLQTKAVQELLKFSIPFPSDFKDKLVSFYESIRLDKFPADLAKFSPIDRDRLGLKIELVLMLLKVDPDRGRSAIEALAKAAPQEKVREMATQILNEINMKGTKEPDAPNKGAPANGASPHR